MGCQSFVVVGNNLTFTITTHDPDTGELTDADSAPAYRVYEDETSTAILTGSMTTLDTSNTTGFYSEQIACTAGNGFEAGKSYNVYIEATVDGDTGGISYGFTALAAAPLTAAEVQAEAEDALEAYDLDHLIQVSAGSEEPTDGAYLDQIMHKSGSQTFSAATDSLEAIRDTLSSSSVTVVAAVDGDDITVVPYTTWEFTIDGLADLSDALANGVLFTVKAKTTDADASAILQVQEGVGLLYINGAAGTAAKATLTVAGSEDEITVHVNASQTGIAERRDLVWDVKKLITSAEDADQMASGAFHIADEAVTRRLTTT